MVSIRAKTPSGAAEVIPTPTEMDSRAVEIERRNEAMAGRAVETARMDGAMVGRAAETEKRMVSMADGTTGETGRAVETASHRERG